MTSFSDQLPRGGTGNARLALRVSAKAVPFLRQRHPWLFADSIVKISRPGAAGDVAVLFDESGREVLGAGLFDPASPVRVKVMAHGAGARPVGPELFAELAGAAAGFRLGKCPPETDAYRLVNGDSDLFPGLVADRYADTLAVKVYAAALVPHLGDLIDAIAAANPGMRQLSLRLSRELQKTTELEDGALFGAPGWDGMVRFRENGLLFEADVKSGQKTGFFLDQRDNRARVEKLSAGTSVLNLFSYSGGFSLYAARGGARDVCSVDFNKHAIAACDAHFKLNSDIETVARCRHRGIAGDAFLVMDQLYREKARFGVVVVDPPSFAKSAAETPTALRAYARLARGAVKLVAPGGILVFASCSSRVRAEELFDHIKMAAAESGFRLDEIDRTFHAFDHPARFKESEYLKCLYARVRPARSC